MTDEPDFDFHFDVTTAEIQAALDRNDYGWLVENVFNPALVQWLNKEHTAALVSGSTRPRSRRQSGRGRSRRQHRTRRFSQVPG